MNLALLWKPLCSSSTDGFQGAAVSLPIASPAKFQHVSIGILNLNGEAACTLSIGSTRLNGGAQIVHMKLQQLNKEQTRNGKQQTTNFQETI